MNQKLWKLIFFLVLVLLALSYVASSRLVLQPPPVNLTLSHPGKAIVTPEQYHRPFNHTLLTFAEWYLVYSPEEYGAFAKHHTTNYFPYLGHTVQFWQVYARVAELSPQKNPEYHTMLWVIGSSTSLEYFVKGIYDWSIGQLTASLSGRSEIDDYAADVAQAYTHFIKHRPWYEFNFKDKLVGLWTQTPLLGNHPIRAIERKYILTTEYLVKWAYSLVIMSATHAQYGVASPNTAIVINKAVSPFKGFEVLKQQDDGRVLALVPRYAPFTDYALMLARQGVQFEEIAGNNGDIAVSVLLPASTNRLAGSHQVLYKQILMTDPSRQRWLISLPIEQLSQQLMQLEQQKVVIEHIYDF